MDTKLFSNVLNRINRILRYNYLESFYQERKVELLSIPSQNHKAHLPKLEYNSIGSDAKAIPGQSHYNNGNKNCNIIEIMLTRKDGLNSVKLPTSASQI